MIVLLPAFDVVGQGAQARGIFSGVSQSRIAPAAKQVALLPGDVIVIRVKRAVRYFSASRASSFLRVALRVVLVGGEAGFRFAALRAQLGVARLAQALAQNDRRGATVAAKSRGDSAGSTSTRSVKALLAASLPHDRIGAAFAPARDAVTINTSVDSISTQRAELSPFELHPSAAAQPFARTPLAELAALARRAQRTALRLFSGQALRAERHGSNITTNVGWQPESGNVLTYWLED